MVNRRRRKIFALGLAMFAALGLAILSWLLADLPPLDKLEAGLALPSTRIYDRHKRLLYEILPSTQGHHRHLALDEMPPHCIQAVIATEDANYYHHPGIDPLGILRALWLNLRGGEIIAGGSTITQQTVRLLLLDPQQQAARTLRRKLREMTLALQLQARFSKDEILELYLNQVYFGNLAYGLDAAARAYFQKDAQDLSLAECALLAGIVQNAIVNDPLTHFERAKARQSVTLGLMAQNGRITAAQAQAAAADRLQFAPVRFPIEAPHVVMEIWRILARSYPQALHQGGLEVIATVDRDWTRQAQAIVQQQLHALNHPQDGSPSAKARNAALVALDAATGEVLTMLGSPDYFDKAIDGAVNAALAYRQPGSVLKPFTYAEAMNPAYPQPYTAATMILDVRRPFVTDKLESYVPANYGLVEHGPVLLREALASSYNIPAVVALQHIGIERFVEFVSRLGLDNLQDKAAADLSLTLGGGEVRLLDVVEAYSAFANGGFDVEPQYIRSIRDAQGRLLFEYAPPVPRRRLIDPAIAYIITDILSDNRARTPAFGASSPLNVGFPAAAKTGTTTDFRDNWVIGYTPELVVGVWVGNADGSSMMNVSGISGAGPIYSRFLRTIRRGDQTADFVKPDGLTRVEICRLSGRLPTEHCRQRITEWFIPGTAPQDFDTFHQAFTIDTVTGQLADESAPAANRRQQVFLVLPPAARDWAIRNGIRQPPATDGDSHREIHLLAPAPYAIYEISDEMPRQAQRLRFRVGTAAATSQVVYRLNGQPIDRAHQAPWDIWWTLAPGEYELAARAILTNGQIQESAIVPFSVVEARPAGASRR